NGWVCTIWCATARFGPRQWPGMAHAVLARGVVGTTLQRARGGAARRPRGEIGEGVAQCRQRARETAQAAGALRLDRRLERSNFLAMLALADGEAIETLEQDVGVVHL